MKYSSFLLLITSVSAQYLYRSLPPIERSLIPRQATTCSLDQVTCSFGGCCPSNTTCQIINNAAGCCPVGTNCGGQTQSLTCGTGTYLCSDNSVCCSIGTVCVVDSQGATGCCPGNQVCSGTTLGVGGGGSSVATSVSGVVGSATGSGVVQSSTAGASATQGAAPQGSCQSGFIACTDGTGGCCPSGSSCIVDSSGVPGCSITCSSTDTSCPGGGCCASGLQCDASRPGFCVGGNNSSSAATQAVSQGASGTVVTRGTVKATASVIGGGGFNFGPTTSSSSLARATALPEVSLLLPSLLMGLIVFGALMAL